MAEILSGKVVAQAISANLEERIANLKAKGVEPCLAIIRMGEEPGDLSYERSIRRTCEPLGIKIELFALGREDSQDNILNCVKSVNADDNIHGCIIMRPLPRHVDQALVCEALAVEKDVDCITGKSLSGLMIGDKMSFRPCTAQACVEILDYYGYALAGERVAVLGRSLAVGRSLSLMLQDRNATVTMCHSKTLDLPKVCKENKILVAAVGKAKLVGSEYVKEGHVIVDVGINVDENGKLCGDVDREAVENTVAAISPVPGGVGGITVAVLASHVIEAAERG